MVAMMPPRPISEVVPAAASLTLPADHDAISGREGGWEDPNLTLPADHDACFGSPGLLTSTQLALALDAVTAFLRRFLYLPSEHAYNALALWVAHTHVMDCWVTTPRLGLMSPEKRCGKTRTIEVLHTLVNDPIRTSNISTASLVRTIHERCPTVFLDEVDTIWTGKGEREDLRSLVNAGYRVGDDTIRMVGEGAAMKATAFRTFAPIALAGIGKLPDTVADRTIHIPMQRKGPDDTVERWRQRINEPEGDNLRQIVANATQGFRDVLTESFPELPTEVDDRAADVWEPLLAVADAAAGDWPTAARAACIALSTGQDETLSPGLRLLADIRAVWPDDMARIPTAALLDLLHHLEDGPWGETGGRQALTGKRLSQLLKPYGVTPGRDDTWRGYYLDDFVDPWRRYLPPE